VSAVRPEIQPPRRNARRWSPRRSLRAAALGAWAVLAATAAGAAGPPPFAPCESDVRARPEVYEVYLCYLTTARASGRFEEADERLAALAREEPHAGWATVLRGHLWLLSDEPRAIARYREAVAIFAATGVARGEVIARHNLRNLLHRRGEVADAAAQVQRAVAAAEAAGDPSVLAQALVLEGTHRVETGGDLGRAHRDLRRAQSLLPGDASYSLRKVTLLALANVSFQLGRFAEAIATYERLLALARANEDAIDEATTAFNIANTRQRQLEEHPVPDGLATLQPLAQAALTTAKRAGHRLVEVRASALLAQLERARGERAAARRRLEEALAVARELDHPERILICLWLLAELAADDDPVEAQRWSAEAAALAVAAGNDRHLAYAWQARTRVDWKTRPRDEAIATSWQALAAVEALAADQPEEAATVGLFGAWARDYRFVAGRLLDGETPDLDAAFAVMERMRARALLASLAARSEGEAPVAVSDAEHEALRELIAVQRQLLVVGLPAAERVALVGQLEERELSVAAARAASRLDSHPAPGGAPAPKPAAGVASATPSGPRTNGPLASGAGEAIGARHAGASRAPAPGWRPGSAVAAAGGEAAGAFANLAALRAALRPREALLLYQLAPWRDLYGDFAGGSWALLATRDRVSVHRLPDSAAIEPLVPVFLGLLARRDGSERPAAERLWRLLLAAPVTALPADVERLVVVPDGALFSLPFEALQPPATAAAAEPLGVRYEVAVVPSATALLRWRDAAVPPAGRSVLILADPELPGVAAGAARDREAVLGGDLELGRLPGARREGLRLARRLRPTSEVLVGAAATERALVRPDLASFAVLHFAAHAIADGAHPQRSAVLLAAADEAEDGLLQTREIARLPLAGRTIVLSACRTAAGAVASGEGPLSLARAFQQAGARAVVGSRWALRDDEAAELVDSLYRRLAKGETLGTALRAVRREAWAGGRPPAAWASFVLMGEPATAPLAGVPIDPDRRRSLLLVLAVAALLAIVALTARQRMARAAGARSTFGP
jgi:CHAT domain-containing protein/tetratricopeptide (TPR) repeat protein